MAKAEQAEGVEPVVVEDPPSNTAETPQETAGGDSAADAIGGAGTAPDAPEGLPVGSYRDAAPFLRRPFTERAVKFKVQATWPKAGPNAALIVPYIDARLVVERLNTVCPDLWHDEYGEPGDTLLCRLTIDGITRPDVGSGYRGKGLYSDALKRAAVKFGVGVSLYAVPKLILNKAEGLKDTQSNGKPSLALTDDGERLCRRRYLQWLVDHGQQAFGPALDHGDLEGAAGDVEADQPEGEQTGDPVPPPEPPLTDDEAAAIRWTLHTKYDELKGVAGNWREVLPPARFNSYLTSTQHSHDRMREFVAHLDQLIGEAKAAQS